MLNILVMLGLFSFFSHLTNDFLFGTLTVYGYSYFMLLKCTDKIQEQILTKKYKFSLLRLMYFLQKEVGHFLGEINLSLGWRMPLYLVPLVFSLLFGLIGSEPVKAILFTVTGMLVADAIQTCQRVRKINEM
ncbi:hypothetical protein OAB57_02980 [Bacteriovoracaceae bacterium]|nr:hypothetical protein [Bacteriovoracaceae bacterium]